jgi:hypothetical protein
VNVGRTVVMRWRIALLAAAGVSAVVVVVVVALWVRNLPLATGALAPTPMSNPAPAFATSKADAVALANPALLDVEESLQITLPPGWQQSSLDTKDLQERLQAITLSDTGPAKVAALLLSHVGRETVLATARLADVDDATVTVSAIARNGLTLKEYLNAAKDALIASGVQVHAANIDGSLRLDGLPVATMHYELATQELAGYQVVAYDASGAKLIVFTFTAPTTDYAGLLPKFHEVVHSTKF